MAIVKFDNVEIFEEKNSDGKIFYSVSYNGVTLTASTLEGAIHIATMLN